ncbi:hypothetical protein M426DRAFT_245443 [Hypoxylon sp. CI-4A]|nr:hypothetical protein M426DRAFT_245443 [Hypoxylon sp. CI-4A]
MDPPTMDYMMGHPEHHPQVASSHASSASACPALQHASMFSTNQPQYPFNPHHHWQRLPLPYAQWGPDPPFHASSSIMQSSNTSQVDQQQYPPSGQEVYNPHQSSAFRNAVSMPGLQRVGGTAPIQHSQQHNQGNLANPIHSRPQGGIAGGAAAENQMHGSRLNGQNGQNGALPSINSVRPLTSQNLQSFVHPARPTLGQHSPPPFIRQTSSPSTAVTTNSAEATVASSTESARSLPHQGTQSPPRRAPTTAARTAEMSNEGSASSARQAGATRNRRGLSRLPSSESGWSSDDDSDHGAVALTLLDAAASGPVGESAQDERTRTQQLLRGAVMNNKRVASKRAITSLESVAISSLPENERTCVICYNDYGAETPEGICEIPLRLPKCKHVFGDHCIKKWFEESDSCPYCRDKVPSEPHNRHSMMLQQMGAHNLYRFLRTQHTHHQQARSNREQERAMELLGENAAGRMNAMATKYVSSPSCRTNIMGR